MRYLGRISGNGMIQCSGTDVARASYSFDGYAKRPAGVSSCGEIRLPHPVLKAVFGRVDVQLLTDEGRLLDLRFSDKALRAATEVAHVDVTGDLPPTPQDWRS
jgi:hypothetical protein